MKTNSDPRRKLENDEADSPFCLTCEEIITDAPQVFGGKLPCLDGNADVCRACCPDVECVQARTEHENDASPVDPSSFVKCSQCGTESSAPNDDFYLFARKLRCKKFFRCSRRMDEAAMVAREVTYA